MAVIEHRADRRIEAVSLIETPSSARIGIPAGLLIEIEGAMYLYSLDLGSPVAASDTGIHPAVTLNAAAQSVSTGITAPDVARNLTVKGSAAAGVKQIETATVVGTVTLAGNAAVIVTGAALTGTPVTYAVPVALSDNASAVAGKIRTFLAAQAEIVAVYTVSGATDKVILTSLGDRANDGTLNIDVDNGTCTGLTAAHTSADTTAGVAGVSGTVVLHTKLQGVAQTEAFTLNGSSSVPGTIACDEFVSADLPAGGGTVSIGVGAKLGLGVTMALNRVDNLFANGVRDTDAHIISNVAVDATHLNLNLWDAAPDGTSRRVDYYL